MSEDPNNPMGYSKKSLEQRSLIVSGKTTRTKTGDPATDAADQRIIDAMAKVADLMGCSCCSAELLEIGRMFLKDVVELCEDEGCDHFGTDHVCIDGGGTGGCYDCHRPYGEPGFPDMIVPEEEWSMISPTGDEGGLLCPSCIIARLEKASLEGVPVYFANGPARMPADAESKHITEVLVKVKERSIVLYEENQELSAGACIHEGWPKIGEGGNAYCPVSKGEGLGDD